MPFVTDTFTAAVDTFLEAHARDDGGSWTAHPAGAADSAFAKASTGHLHGNGNGLYYASGTPAAADYTVQADFLDPGSEDEGVCARMDTTAATFYLVQRPSSTTLNLYKCVAGSFTLDVTATITTGTHTVRFDCFDAGKNVYLDGSGTAVLTSGDNTITAAGRAGVRVSGGELDNYTATDATSPPPPPAAPSYLPLLGCG